MKAFVIILKNHNQSELFGKVALETAKKTGWDVYRFDGINGNETTLAKHNIVPNTTRKKITRSFLRPGVVGCFLSHYNLWNRCIELNEPIGIFEQDVIFKKSPPNVIFKDVLRLDQLQEGKDYGTGQWWEGSHAYFITPNGAKKLISWTHAHGAFPSDVIIGSRVVDIQFSVDDVISLNSDSKKYSLTQGLTIV